MLTRTTFIAITGSVGKTTCKECLATILEQSCPTAKTLRNQNDYSGVPRSLLRVRPRHRFAVLELAANGLGAMYRSAPLVRPDMAIVLAVAWNHRKNFRTLENVAKEKSALPANLTKAGIALLNGDDPLVAGMAASLRQRVVRFGASPDFDYWANETTSKWPGRFSFTVHAGKEHARVHTQLLGAHWMAAVLGAIAAAHLSGIPLSQAAEAVRAQQPVAGRMQAVMLPNGAVVIRDDLDGSIGTLSPAFRMMEEADAPRKILVISGMTDSPLSPRDRYRRLGKDIGRIFDSAVFIGADAHHGASGAVAGGMPAEQAFVFRGLEDAVPALQRALLPGDLILLKGRRVDHVARLVFALAGTIRCWKQDCKLMISCDDCRELGASTPLQPAGEPGQTTAWPPLPDTTEAG